MSATPRRMLVGAARGGLALAAALCCCNLYDGRTLEFFADVGVRGAECRDSSACPRDRSLCTGGVCLECRVDDDCGPRRPWCVDGACAECRADDGCPSGQGCNRWLGACAFSCTEASDCAGQPLPLCSAELDLCVQCQQDVDCVEPGNPVCQSGGRCVECTDDAHCPVERPSCDSSSGRCVECTASAQCDGDLCDPRERRCVECLADPDCTEPGKPACIPATRRCGECTRDAQCSEDQRCDRAAARCVPAPEPPGPPASGEMTPPGPPAPSPGPPDAGAGRGLPMARP